MSDLGDLQARKQLLVARSTLQRLTLQRDAISLRQSFVSPRTAFNVATSAPVRNLVFSVLLLVAGPGRMSKLLRGAMGLLAVLNAGRAVMSVMKTGRGPGEG